MNGIGEIMADKEISQAVISRLPRYFRYLGDLKEKGVERISSQELSDIMKVTASQINEKIKKVFQKGLCVPSSKPIYILNGFERE